MAKKLTKDELLLLQDFSRNVSTKSSALFYGNAFVMAIVPLWLYWRVHQMEPIDAWFWWIVGTAATTYALAFAYKNDKFVLKHKIAQKRADAVAREIQQQYGSKINKKEQDERVLWKKNEVADYEASTFAIFYNNALFLCLMLALSLMIFANAGPTINYMFSVVGAAGFVALFSTGTK